MERRHFRMIAKVVKNLTGITYDQRTEIATDFADVLDTTYKKFDYEKFMDACLMSDKDEQGLQEIA